MHVNLSGKSALVTGSTAGIGLAIAKGLATTGASVWVNGRKQETVNHAVDVIKAAPGAHVRGIVADVATEAGCKALAGAVPATDILVNNAGIFEPKPFFDIPDADWMPRPTSCPGCGCRGPTCRACSPPTGAASSSSPPNPP
jgi:NAD(P)-dependent dehydrogenase (short-subunit alcohol dehydrogenase family)